MDFTSVLLIRHLTDISDINKYIETIFLRTYKFIHIRRFYNAVSPQYLFDKLCNYIDLYTSINTESRYHNNTERQRQWNCERPFIRGRTNENIILVGYESIKFIALDYYHNHDKRLDSNVIYKKYLSIDDIISEYYKMSSTIDYITRLLYGILCENTRREQMIEYINNENTYDEGEHYVIAFVFDADDSSSCFTSDEDVVIY